MTCLAILATWVCFLAICLGLPRSYKSECSLFLKMGRESIGLDPTATMGDMVELRTSRETEINSVLRLLSSQAIATRVVDRLGPEKILSEGIERTWLLQLFEMAKTAKSKLLTLLPNENGSPQTSDRHRAAESLLSRLNVTAPEDSVVITVSCTAPTPTLAQEIVSTLVDVYVDEHMRLNRTDRSDDFFLQQSEIALENLSKSRAALRDLKNDIGLTSVEGEQLRINEQRGAIGDRIRVNTAAQAATRSRLTFLEQAIDQMEETIRVSWVEGLPQIATDGMRQQLYELELKQRDLLSKFTEDHPAILAISDAVKQAGSILESQDKIRIEPTFGVNPNRQHLELQYLQDQAALQSLEEEGIALKAQQQELLAELQKLNRYQMQIEELEQQSKLLGDNYFKYLANLEQARIDSELERQRITNVNVVHEATIPSKPSGPSRLVLAALGLVVAICAGVSFALLLEFWDDTLYTIPELELAFGVPVWVTIPKSRSNRVHLTTEKS